MAKVLGLLELNWRGQKIDIEKGAKVKLGGLQQKPVITGKQVDHADEFMQSEVTATAKLKAGDSLLAIWAPGAGELIAKCDTGQTYSWPDAFLTNRPEFTAGEGGKVPLAWAAGEPVELVG